MARDLYAVLGVPKTADEDTIKKAFRKLAVKFHPDKTPGKAAEEKFKEANRAHEVLADKQKRALYDEFGEDSLQQGFDADRARMYKQYGGGGRSRGGGRGAPDFVNFGGGGGMGGADFSDLFGDFMGRAQRQQPQRPRKSPDQEASVTIDFVSALRGTTVSFQRESGEPLTIRIPAGVASGARLKVDGQGGSLPGALPGDLHINIEVSAHAFFKRENDDLTLDLPITVVEALEGAKVRVPTLDGEVALKVPPRTQSGQVLRLKGKGVQRKGKDPGDLFVRFLIRIPDVESPEIAKAVEILRPLVTDPRVGLVL